MISWQKKIKKQECWENWSGFFVASVCFYPWEPLVHRRSILVKVAGEWQQQRFCSVCCFCIRLSGKSRKQWGRKCQGNCLLVWILCSEYGLIWKTWAGAGKKCSKKLEKFIARGYIRNIQIDREGNYIMITAPNRRVNEKIYITVTCPSCGAKNQVIKGRLSTCEYCGQRLTPW